MNVIDMLVPLQSKTGLMKLLAGNSLVRNCASSAFLKTKSTSSSYISWSANQRMYPVLSRSISSSKQLLHTDKILGGEYEEGKLIYFGTKSSLVKRVQAALYVIGAGIVIPSPYIFSTLADKPLLQGVYMTWVGLFGIGNPMMFYKFARRYVIELYHNKNSDTYMAVVPSSSIIKRSKVEFSTKDCEMPDKPTAFASFLVKGMPLLVSSSNMDYFAYSRMLRYAVDFDYENPDRQSQYEETLQEAMKEIGSEKSKVPKS